MRLIDTMDDMEDEEIIVATDEDVEAANEAHTKEVASVPAPVTTPAPTTVPVPTPMKVAPPDVPPLPMTTPAPTPLPSSLPPLPPKTTAAPSGTSTVVAQKTLPGDERVQKALRAVSVPPTASPFAGLKEVMTRAVSRKASNDEQIKRGDRKDEMGSISASVPSATQIADIPKDKYRADTSITSEPRQNVVGSASKKVIVNPSVLRTMEADSAEFIRANKVSVTGVALKEAARQRSAEKIVAKSSKKNVILAVLSTLFVIGGGALMLYILLPEKAPVVVQEEASRTGIDAVSYDPIIFTESKKQIDLSSQTSLTAYELLTRNAGNANQTLGSIQSVFLSRTSSLDSLLSGSEFLEMVTARAPDRLIRHVGQLYTYGVHTTALNSGFLILTTQSYATVFADMLSWERDMVRDLYGPLSGRETTRAFLEARWSDKIVRNIDVRVLNTEEGEEDDMMVWGFANQNTIVIARNENTFREVLTRLTTPKPVTR